MIEVNPRIKILERYRDIIPDYNNFINYALRKPDRYIRVNTKRIKPNELSERLSRYGIKVERVEELDYVFKVVEGVDLIGKTLEYYLGFYYIQEFVSLIPPLILEPSKGDVILDVAAAPGGKILHIADLLGKDGLLIANEPDKDRYKALIANIDRMGYSNIIVISYDARLLPPINVVNKILFDAPCSNENMLYHIKDSDLKIYLSKRVYQKYSNLQKGILRALYYLMPNDTLILYCVCTYAPEESEEVVDYAVKLGYMVESINLSRYIKLNYTRGITRWRGVKYDSSVLRSIRIYPHLNERYGHIGYTYISLLRIIK